LPKKTVDETIEIAPVAMGTIQMLSGRHLAAHYASLPAQSLEQLLFPKGRANAPRRRTISSMIR